VGEIGTQLLFLKKWTLMAAKCEWKQKEGEREKRELLYSTQIRIDVSYEFQHFWPFYIGACYKMG